MLDKGKFWPSSNSNRLAWIPRKKGSGNCTSESTISTMERLEGCHEFCLEQWKSSQKRVVRTGSTIWPSFETVVACLFDIIADMKQNSSGAMVNVSFWYAMCFSTVRLKRSKMDFFVRVVGENCKLQHHGHHKCLLAMSNWIVALLLQHRL